MSLWQQLWHQAVQWFRRRRRANPAPRLRTFDLEQLGHRQLLSVNFTGNVYTDFPGTTGPVGSGAVVLNQVTPGEGIIPLPGDVAPYIEYSGFDINGIRLVYDPTQDILSVGIQQPVNTAPVPAGADPAIAGNAVIAGDADDNGDNSGGAGSVNPNVLAARPDFVDFANLSGSEFLGIGLDLNDRIATNPDNTIDDVVAGIAGDQNGVKSYQVAAYSATGPNHFGPILPQFTGASFQQDDPAHGGFEFSINHFSELYAAETGKTLSPSSVIGISAFGGSANDDGIGESSFGEQSLSLGTAPLPPPPPPPPPTVVCPPQNPMVLINYHENNHVNTAHPELVRVSVLGNSGFDVTEIDPTSVRLGGAAPIATFFRHVNKDQFLDETFVFRGDQISLPSGFTNATLTGKINNGMAADSNTFSTTISIFNRDDSYYTPGQLNSTEARRERIDASIPQFLAGDVIANGVTPTVSASTFSSNTVKVAAVLPTETASAAGKVSAPRAAKGKYAFKPVRVSSAAAKSLATAY